MNGRLWSLLLLLGLGVVAWWLGRETQPLPDTPRQVSRGYYLKQATIRQTDASGNILYALKAANIVQDVGNERVLLENIDLQYQRAATPAWRLEARRGWLNTQAQTARFEGEVSIAPDLSNQKAQLLTDTLNVDLVREQATTPDRVLLRMNEQQLTAQGLKADLKAQTLRLESQIHGLFQLPDTVLP